MLGLGELVGRVCVITCLSLGNLPLQLCVTDSKRVKYIFMPKLRPQLGSNLVVIQTLVSEVEG